MKQNFFILKAFGLYWVKDMPVFRKDLNDLCIAYLQSGSVKCDLTVCICDERNKEYEFCKKAAIDSSIRVYNQREVMVELRAEHGQIIVGEMYPLECEVATKEGKGDFPDEMFEQHYDNTVAFVKLKEETKETPIKELEAVTKEEISEEEIIKMIKLEYDKYKDSSYVDVLKTISKVLLSNFTITKRQ